MALNKPAHVNLSRQFEQRQVKKTYVARVYGEPQHSKGTVELPLICDWPNRPKQMVDHDNGKPATTHWQVLDKEENTTMMQLTPVTGRSHQLRVHMLELGLPIVGDQLYATGPALTWSDRLALHSQRLSFTHPVTSAPMTFESLVQF